LSWLNELYTNSLKTLFKKNTHYQVQLNCRFFSAYPTQVAYTYWFRKWVADWFGTVVAPCLLGTQVRRSEVLGLLTGGQATVIHHTPILLSLLAAEWFWS